MSRVWLYRIGLILLVLALLFVGLGPTFASAVHTNCCVQVCIPCLNLAKLQGAFRQFGGVFGAPMGLLAMLIFLLIALGEILPKQHVSNLVTLKMRLNN